ncbi:MAG: hypothetical protein HDS41_05175 [Bacteroides sp.]|nr:hypothetical protein [Bacteroides sp.]
MRIYSLSVLKTLVIIGIMCTLSGCFPTDESQNIIQVVNVGDYPVYIDVTSENVENDYSYINECFPLLPNETWHYQGYLDWLMSKTEFFSRYCHKMKFVIMACDEGLKCNPDSILEVIELNQEQLFHLHQCLYYPVPEHDRAIIERYKN